MYVCSQRVTISALPQVQKLSITLSDTDPDVIVTPLSNFNCIPLNMTVQDRGEVVIGNAALPVGTGVTEGQIEEVLNSIEAIQRVGSIQVHVVPITTAVFEVVFVFATNSSVLPSDMPTLQLAVDSGSCIEAESGSLFQLAASLTTSQMLTHAHGFTLSFDSLRYTPNLPINASSNHLEQALSDLLTWKCAHPLDWILSNDSYEGSSNARDNGADTPRAYCGLYSKQSPGVVWERKGKASPKYVSPSSCTYAYTHVAVTGRKRTVSGPIRLVISLECFVQITPDFMCPFMND